MKKEIVTVFGGTGFLGRYVVKELADRGYRIKVVTRTSEKAYYLKPCGSVGQIVAVGCDYSDIQSLKSVIKGSSFVVNLVAIAYKKKKGDFERLHTELAGNMAKACAETGVEAFTHVSAIAVDRTSSEYARTKLDGEEAIRGAFPKAAIIRPSVMFGEDDDFFNKFAELSRYLPFLPLIGGGNTKFQPVYVGDVANAVVISLLDHKIHGDIFELGGPEILTFKEIYERIFKHTGRSRPLIKISFCMAKLQAFFMGMLPKPLLTIDQVNSLKSDNVANGTYKGFEAFNIASTALDLVLPRYLERYKKGGRFGESVSA